VRGATCKPHKRPHNCFGAIKIARHCASDDQSAKRRERACLNSFEFHFSPLLNKRQASNAEACAGFGFDVHGAEFVNGENSDSLQFAENGHFDFLANDRF
jgi:hypothetical protein